jgi:hypothetical protein
MNLGPMSPALHILAQQNVPQEKGGSLGVSIEIVAATVLACALLTATVLLLTKFRRRRDAMIIRERQARERMQELCPDGWTARIVLYGDGAPLPDDAPAESERTVCVEWAEYESDAAGHTDVAVARRMWARTITGALRGMLADRELDVELERIERKVIEDTSEGGETSPPAAGPRGTTDP